MFKKIFNKTKNLSRFFKFFEIQKKIYKHFKQLNNVLEVFTFWVFFKYESKFE